MSNEPTIFELAVHAPHRINAHSIRNTTDMNDTVAVFCDRIDAGADGMPIAELRGCKFPYPKLWIEYRSALAEGGLDVVFACFLREHKREDGHIINGLCYQQGRETDSHTPVTDGPIASFTFRTNSNGDIVSLRDDPNSLCLGVALSEEYQKASMGYGIDVVGAVVRDALYAISLMNCKNIEVVDGGFTDDGLSPKQIRGGGRFRVAFKVLKVTVGKTRTYVLGKATSGESANLPVHLVRGHFAEYTPERPMFGRNGSHGKFWIPAHARGTIENGIVVKDYEVTA